ncbi:hypothetical protein [Bradyrhizobium sp. CCGUVB23]|uniref:hypothetical protein n=1 Tax=Bradyrhizobium sp. CCGUVB23 TaxID=2949630 RepID=UPI0020B30746|nr:hypothetical protein [Bradyrhizobium sp. CCGUVB23]MCP3462910.1 hypothetical protein [Bradyrhizobium sp. CCGUVB23]
MSRISILKRTMRTAAAGLIFVGLLSPANATYPHEAVSIFLSTTSDHAAPKTGVAASRSMVLPWLAPVGHRQPSCTIEVAQIAPPPDLHLSESTVAF